MNHKLMTRVILVVCIQQIQSLSVRYIDEQPIYVSVGRDLVLETVIEKLPQEKVLMVTWERTSDAGARRLATIPGKTQDSRISTAKDGATLRISGLQESDFGHYTITVTDQDGTQTFKGKDVRKNDRPPETSVVLLCDVSAARAQWDRPVVTWLVDGVKLTNQTANTSEGGSKLHLQEVKGRNYTCISDSSLGTSTAHFILADSTQIPGHLSLITVIVILCIVFAAVSVIFYCLYTKLKKTIKQPDETNKPLNRSQPIEIS
ncbi:uncharacterized protein LOC134449021 isoform X1 [Engraulis encrasicolus]|uniref:uncharacterized protein LOC134449021 isoform X1 n=1 Tax=Engraulis encrasicolus TaxID=184585 RepID=UPI002FD3526B